MIMGLSTTIILIIVNAIFTYMGFQDQHLFEKYKFSVGGINRGEYYRMISGAFLHADWNHFFFNMLTLYFFGGYVESYIGTTNFLLVYFGGLLLGHYLAYHLHKNDDWYAAIGNSAAVNAVVFSAIALEPMMKLYLFFAIPIPGIIFAIGYLYYTSMGTQSQTSNIGHEAHFGGAIAGVALTILLDFYHAFSRHPMLSILLIAALVGAYFYINNKRK